MRVFSQTKWRRFNRECVKNIQKVGDFIKDAHDVNSEVGRYQQGDLPHS